MSFWKEDKKTTLKTTVIGALIGIGLAYLIVPEWVLFPIFGDPFWRMPTAEIFNFWWIPLWAVVGNLIAWAISKSKFMAAVDSYGSPGEVLVEGAFMSFLAGTVEELIYRWILFLDVLVTMTALNLLFCGIPEWFQETIFIPLTHYGTFGLVDHLLYHPLGWVVGAAIIGTSISFRDAHEYQGPLGWISAWYFSITMFYVLFTQGIVACMILHFVFNMTAFSLLAVIKYFRDRKVTGIDEDNETDFHF